MKLILSTIASALQENPANTKLFQESVSRLVTDNHALVQKVFVVNVVLVVNVCLYSVRV